MRSCLLFWLIIGCHCLCAQQFSIQTGVGIAKLLDKDDNLNYGKANKPRLSLHLQGAYELRLGSIFSLQFGLAYEGKGTNVKASASNGNYRKGCISLHYLQLPASVSIKQKLNEKGLAIYAQLGMYVAYGFSGRIKITTSIDGQEQVVDRKISWGKDPEAYDYLRYDSGMIFGCGLEYKSYLFELQYTQAISNISAYVKNNHRLRPTVLKFSLGYHFGR